MSMRLGVVALLISALAASPALCGDEILDCCGVISDTLLPPHMRIGSDMPRLAEQATFLFIGRVVKAETSPCCDRLADVTLRASKVWKGLGLHTVIVRTGAAADTPFPFAIGQEYLVATLGSQDPNGRFGLHPGFRPVELSSATQLIQALDDWRRAKYDAEQPK
jgi:hypothetical protein